MSSLKLSLMLALAVILTAIPASAEIMNDDEYGSLEIRDISVIKNAAGIYTPVGLIFNVSRGNVLYPGDIIEITYKGVNDSYASLIDYSPDRKVKPIVLNEKLTMLKGLEGFYSGVVGPVTGTEYVLLVVTRLPISDSELEKIALAPDEFKKDENKNVLNIAVNEFTVAKPWNDGRAIIDWADSHRPTHINSNDILIPLEDMAIYLDYPLNTPGYNPWRYMYLYPYPRFRPVVYVDKFGPLTKQWYFFPQYDSIKSNFWDYSSSGWISNGLYVIPPGGYWQGTFRTDNPYGDYFLRILPFITRDRANVRFQVEINGNLVQPSIDYTQAIGYGQYWTTNPFEYYSVARFLRAGDNQIRITVPEDADANLELQMADVVPSDVIKDEFESVSE